MSEWITVFDASEGLKYLLLAPAIFFTLLVYILWAAFDDAKQGKTLSMGRTLTAIATLCLALVIFVNGVFSAHGVGSVIDPDAERQVTVGSVMIESVNGRKSRISIADVQFDTVSSKVPWMYDNGCPRSCILTQGNHVRITHIENTITKVEILKGVSDE